MIGSSENRVSYNGNGNAKEFAFEFKILNASDIKVLLVNADGTEKLLTKDYFVDIEKSVVRYPGYAPGAELPLEQQPPILPTGSKLVLYREVPITQQTKLDQFRPFNVIEAALDKLTIICQQLSDGFSRCLKLSEGVPKDVNPTIPVEVGKSFRWSDDGKKIVLTDDPAKVLPQANEVLKRTEAARDVAIAKADAAGASAVSAAESEDAADRSATQAEAAKTNAKASEVAAKASQAAAKVSEGNAKTSETNALTHENNAKASADKAKVSETYAKSSETVATTKASEASVSAEKAKASEVAAKASQAAAKVSETNAKTSEGKAKTSETAAKTSETNAANGASTATTKASEASLSAANAKTSETNAGKSASAASASQTAAKASETSAANSASTATAKASEASASATKAKTSETTATQQATKATTEANRAKTEADRAKTAADSVGNPVVSITQSNGNLTVTKGDGSSDTLTVTPAKASQAEAEAGTDDTKMMTPLKVLQSIKKYIAAFLMTAVFTGIIKGVTPPNDANDKTIPTTEWVQALLASKVMSLIVQDYLLEQNGYVRFRFGLILQWGLGKTEKTTTFPIAFKTVYSLVALPGKETLNRYENLKYTQMNNTEFTISMSWGTHSVDIQYIAIGV